jgi:hypothetical protein
LGEEFGDMQGPGGQRLVNIHLRDVALYLVHVIIGTVGPDWFGTLASWFNLATAGLLPARIGRSLAWLVAEPFFPLPVLAGLVLGYLVNRRLRNWFAALVWVPPAAALIYTIATWRVYAFRTYWEDVWASLFLGKDIASVLITAPFYTAVAYSVGSYAGYRSGRPLSSRAKLED